MDITPAIIADFRAYFDGQFSDQSVWSDDIVEQVLCDADSETGGSGWGGFEMTCKNFKRRGMYLYAANMLSFLYANDPANGISPEARLNVQSKSVGDESIAYRVPGMMDVGNDALTFTAYGQLFWRMRKRAGMGARVI